MKILPLKKGYIIVDGILLFLLIILFATPRFARWYIVKKGPDIIGRNILVGKIRINYFTVKLRNNGLIFN
jgi:hypothetical protein